MTDTTKDTGFWDKSARKYAARPVSDPQGYEQTLERTRQFLKPEDHVLEFGCGTGSTAFKLAPHVAHYLATDISGEMIAIGEERAAKEDTESLRFEQATPDNPAWVDQSFDAIIGFNILHLMVNRKEVYENFQRILKPGGYLITKTPCLKTIGLFMKIAIRLMQAVGRAPTLDFFNADELEAELTAAGFELIERERHGTNAMMDRPFLVMRKA